MIPKIKKLTGYSTSAAAFLLLGEIGNSQVVYQNIDPDIVLSGDDIFDLDFNADGIIDIHFEANFQDSYFIYTYETQSFIINNFDAVINDSDYPGIYGAKNLSLFSTIGDAASWNFSDEIILHYCQREIFDFLVTTFTSIYSNWNVEDQYLGLRFQIDGNTHYGWVRLSLQDFYFDYPALPKLVIQDFAYESIPGTTIEINSEVASIAKNLTLIDAGETNTPEDLKLTFTKAENESSVSTYKIYLYKYIYAGTIPTIDSLGSLPADRFTEIIPTGSNIEYNFNSLTLDIEGDPISIGTGEDYIAIVISEPDGIISNENNISLHSNIESIVLRSTYPINWLDLTDPGISGNSSDFVVEFDKGYSELGTLEYRTFISPIYELEIPYLLSKDSNYYVTTIPTGMDEYLISIPSDKLIVGVDGPFLYEMYYPNVLSIPDSIYATNPRVKSGSGTFFYFSPYPEAPIVTLEGISGTPADFKVQFNKIHSEFYLTEYRLYLVPEDSLDLFTPEFALAIDENTYTRVFPFGSNINNFLDASTLDCYNNVMEPGIVYRVFVGMVHLDAPNDLISLSYPSEPITVYTDIDMNNSPTSLVCVDNIVTITNLQKDLQISIFNSTGQKLFDKKTHVNNEVIDLNYLTAGIYMIVVANKEERLAKKITILH